MKTRRSFALCILLFGLVGRAAEDPPVAPPPVQCPAGAISTRIHAVLFRGNRVGYQTTCVLADGSRQVDYAFNDRGRGPHLKSTITVDGAGIPASIVIDGSDSLKSPIAERFSLTAGVPEEQGVLARALLAAPGQRLFLLPQGEASIVKAGERKVTKGSQSLVVSQYSIAGLGFAPVDLWLDERNELFATVDAWLTLIPEGWESAAAGMKADQDARAGTRRAEQAKRLRRVPRAALAFTHANVFDAAGAKLRPRTTVVVTGNRITAVGDDGAVTIPKGAEVIDVLGMTLMPGLWDMHGHPSEDDGILYLAAGVTSVRDMAAEVEDVARFAPNESGRAIGPRASPRSPIACRRRCGARSSKVGSRFRKETTSAIATRSARCSAC